MIGIFCEVLNLTIPVIPIAQPRQRHRVVSMGARAIATNYTPATDPVNAYKAALQLAVGQARQTPLLGPLVVCIRFYLPRPKALMKKSSPADPIPHVGRPDFDNLLKSTQDALNGVAWLDDRQVFHHDGSGKWYCEKDGRPRVEIRVSADASTQNAFTAS